MKKVAGRLRLDLAQYRELEAFAQFGSELDQATQSALNRGEKMVATLNQPQYQPWPMEEQVVALYAGVNGLPRRHPDRGRAAVPGRAARAPARRRRRSTRRSARRATSSDETGEQLNAEIEKVKSGFQSSADRKPRSLASTQDLKRRVRSITNTRKLTRAMELVASARLRRAQLRIEAMRPYADRMLELMAGVSQARGRGAAAAARAARERRDGRDRAGHRRPRARRRVQRPGAAARVRAHAGGPRPRARRSLCFPSGKKAASTLRFRRLEVAQAWTGLQRPAGVQRRAGDGARARRGVRRTARSTASSLVYNAFVSPLVQR